MGAGSAEKDRPARPRDLTPGQLRYEKRRADAAGVTLEKWMASKARAAAEAAAPSSRPAAPARKGLIARLLDRAHKPL